MSKRDKAPPIIVQRTLNGLMPCTAYDSEMLGKCSTGQLFELKARSNRSNQHLSLYWLTLERVIQATDKWPTKEHLHDQLKIVCGYVSYSMDLETGELIKVPDSISFGAMKQNEFNVYFGRAMEKLAEVMGYDPLGHLEKPA